MTFFPRLYLSCPFEVVEIGDDVMAVSVGGEGSGYNGAIALKNEPARFMFEKLQGGITLVELVKACADKYTDSTPDEIGPQVVAFLDALREKGLLVADQEHGIKIDDIDVNIGG